MAHVVVVGGGIGGVAVASELRKHLHRGDRITLVDKEGRHVFQPDFLWVMMGWRRPERIQRDLGRLSRRGIDVVTSEVRRLNLEARELETSAGPVAYDRLVLAPGADQAPDALEGFSAARNLYTLEGATRLRDDLSAFRKGKVVISISSTPFKCPAAPYEAAFLLDYYFRRLGVRDSISIDIVTPEPQPMPVAGPDVGKALVSMLRERGIGYHPLSKPSRIDEGTREVVLATGDCVPFDLLVGVPPHRAPAFVRDAGLTDGSGWIPVDSRTLKTSTEHVYALGDVTSIKLANGMLLPKAGVFAHGQAKVLARILAAELASRSDGAAFDGTGHCWVETGFGKAAFGSGDFYASPGPRVNLRGPRRSLRWGKVFFERYWLWRWF